MTVVHNRLASTKKINPVIKTLLIALVAVFTIGNAAFFLTSGYADETNQNDLSQIADRGMNSLKAGSAAHTPTFTTGNGGFRNGTDDWLHYSIDLIWDIADENQKINQTVDSTSSTDVLQPKYKFTVQTSTVDYAPEAMEFTLPLALFDKRTDLKDKDGNVLVHDVPAFYPVDISISDNPGSTHANSFYYTMDEANNKLIIKNKETVYAGTNATIQVRYNLDPDSIYDMSIGKIQAKGNCTPTSETPGVVLPAEEATSREITYQLDTGFSSLNIVDSSCSFEPYTIKNGYRYYKVRLYSHPYGNQEYDQEFAFDFLETGGQVVGPVENVDTGTSMTPAEAAAYYKGHSYGRLQGEGANQTSHHNSGDEIRDLVFYVRYPDSDEVKVDKVKITTTITGSDNDGYNHEDPDHNDIVSGSKSFSHTWVKYPNKPIGEYYKSPRGQERSRIEIFTPTTANKTNGAAYFVIGAEDNPGSVVGWEGDNNTLVITDTGLVPEDSAPEFDYEFTGVYIPLINATPRYYNKDAQSIVPYDSDKPWFDNVKVEGSSDGSNWGTVYDGDGTDYNGSAPSDLWYGKGYKQFRITFSGIKEGVVVSGEFARAALKSSEYSEWFLTRQDLDQYRNWMNIGVYKTDGSQAYTTEDWAMLTLKPYEDKGHSSIAKNVGDAISDPETEMATVKFNITENLVFDATSIYAIYNTEYLQGFGKELKKLEEKAPQYFESIRILDKYGDAKLYDLLPPGYHFEEVTDKTPPYNETQYWINGKSSGKLHPSYEVIENYKGTGREMVIFTFPTGTAIENEYSDSAIVNIRASVNYNASIKWEDLVYYQNERNFVAGVSENGIPVFNGFSDDGAPERESVNLPAFQDDLMTDEGTLAYYDVDGDGDTTTPNMLYTYVLVSPNVVMSSQSGIEKDIMGDSGEWCKLDHTDINKTYKYRIRVSSADSGKLSDLIIYDTLEEAANTNEWEGEVPWKGEFQSVDTSWLERHGFAPVVYYSTADPADLDYNIITGRENNPWINDTDLWSTELPDDPSSVTAVAVDCRKMADGSDAELVEAQGVEFEIKMTAPSEYPTLKDPRMIYAYNRPAYSCQMYASFSAEPDYFTDIGHRVQIYLEPKGTITLKKIFEDGENDPEFVLEGPDGFKETFRYSDMTDGEYVITNLAMGQYKIYEKFQDPAEAFTVSFDGAANKTEESDEEGNRTISGELELSLDEDNPNPDDYAKTVTITNTHNSGKTEVKVTKTWDDGNNADGIRPASVDIALIVDGEETDKVLTLDETNGWKGSFTDLPKYKNGKEISYAVSEPKLPELYSCEITGNATDGFVVKNSHTPEEKEEFTSIRVVKVWDDQENTDNLRPAEITVRLYADGEDTGMSAVANIEGEWTVVFENLVKGPAYTVVEDAVEGYTCAITGDAESGFTLTNTHKPKDNELKEKEPDGGSSKDDTPKKEPSSIPKPTPTPTSTPTAKTGTSTTANTADASNPAALMMILVIAIAAGTLAYRRMSE